MLAINHALTGAIIGFAVGVPVIALPLAFVSHFVCDALPHFGMPIENEIWLKTKTFRNMLIIDASLCLLLVGIIAYKHSPNWIIVSVCAFLATSPDLVWINKFRLAKKNKQWRPSLFSKFAASIQWFERPIGAFVELTWFIASLVIISIYI